MASITAEQAKIIHAIRMLRGDFVGKYAPFALKVKNKDGQVVPFVPNTAQKYFHGRLERQLKEQQQVRALVLKGRQQGISTYVAGRYYYRTTGEKGLKTYILSHESRSTTNLFNMVKRYHDHCPPAVKAKLRASNARELLFDALDSGYGVGTAGNADVGRGETIHLFHGCLAEGTLVVMPNGDLVPVEALTVGDPVITKSGQVTHITVASAQQKPCLEVSLRGLTSFPLRATPEHKFWTKDGWRELGGITVGDEIGFPVAKIRKHIQYFDFPCEPPVRQQSGGRWHKPISDVIDATEELGRVLGLFLAEGTIKYQSHKSGHAASVQFAVHRDEVARTLEWLETFEGYFSSASVSHREPSLTSVVSVYGRSFAKFVEDLCGETDNKRLPMMWRDCGEPFCQGLLHGYLEGDGHIEKTCRRIRATSVRPAITVGMRDLAASLGYGWAGIDYKVAAVRDGRNERAAFTFALCGEGVDEYCGRYGYSLPPRKNAATRSLVPNAANSTRVADGYAWLRVRSLETCGTQNVYDFEVADEEHSYCILHGATHNSEAAYWDNADEIMSGLGQAIPQGKGTEVILESTSAGLGNMFAEMWSAAETGKSDYQAVFIPWYWQDEYTRAAPPDWTPDDEEKEYGELYDLDSGQLYWRHRKIADDFKGDQIRFKREYPANSAEAFQASDNESFIRAAAIYKARQPKKIELTHSRIHIGVDPAWEGNDRTAVFARQGRKSWLLGTMHGLSPMEVAGFVFHKVNAISKDHDYVVMVDSVGLGAGIYDRLRELGVNVIPVNVGETARDPERYANKRAELYAEMRDWLLEEPIPEIPDRNDLHADLLGPQYTYDSRGRLKLESKEDMRKRGVRSPDLGDALAMTFALPNPLNHNALHSQKMLQGRSMNWRA